MDATNLMSASQLQIAKFVRQLFLCSRRTKLTMLFLIAFNFIVVLPSWSRMPHSSFVPKYHAPIPPKVRATIPLKVHAIIPPKSKSPIPLKSKQLIPSKSNTSMPVKVRATIPTKSSGVSSSSLGGQ